MALPAGRKGVLPSELTPEGKIKIAVHHMYCLLLLLIL